MCTDFFILDDTQHKESLVNDAYAYFQSENALDQEVPKSSPSVPPKNPSPASKPPAGPNQTSSPVSLFQTDTTIKPPLFVPYKPNEPFSFAAAPCSNPQPPRDTTNPPRPMPTTPNPPAAGVFGTPLSTSPQFTGFSQYSKGWSPATGIATQTTSPSGFPFGDPTTSAIRFGVPSTRVGDAEVAQNIQKANLVVGNLSSKSVFPV